MALTAAKEGDLRGKIATPEGAPGE
jgi:hypothetical protein